MNKHTDTSPTKSIPRPGPIHAFKANYWIHPST